MKIAISRYELQPVKGSQRLARRGALLQLTFKDGSTGYCDLHPWPEIGDVPLNVQLELMACGHYTPLVLRAFSFARLDADARKAGRSLFTNLTIPNSHFHLVDVVALPHDFESFLQHPKPTIKLKVGKAPEEEVKMLLKWSGEILKAGAKLRLDFNCRLTPDSTSQFLTDIAPLTPAIDFLEDPFPYHPAKWRQFREDTGLKLACDCDSLQALAHLDSCDLLVVKPAIQEVFPFLGKARGGRSIVVTSYLDHPIGQLGAAYVAAQSMHTHPEAMSLCGLLTHHAYEKNAFSNSLSIEGTRLVPEDKGPGFGFCDILQGLSWRSVG